MQGFLSNLDHDYIQTLLQDPTFCLLLYKLCSDQCQEFLISILLTYSFDETKLLTELDKTCNHFSQNQLLTQFGIIKNFPDKVIINVLFLKNLDIALSNPTPPNILNINDQWYDKYDEFAQIQLSQVFLNDKDPYNIKELLQIEPRIFALSGLRDQLTTLFSRMFCAIQLRKKEFLLFIQKSTPENISRHIQDYKFDISQLQFLLFLVYIVQQPMQTSIRLKLVDFKIIFPYVHFLSVISLLSYRITPLKLVIINLSDDITLLQYQYEKIQSIYDEFQYKIPKHITKRCLTVESTGRIYCQRNIDDSIPKLLDFFCELIYSLPHMYVYELRRDILRKSGIKSQLICKFIQENLVHGRQFPVDLVNLINVWEEKDVEEGDQLTCKLEFKFRDDYKQTDRLSYVHILKYCIDKNCALMYNELYYTKIIKQADELMDLYKRPQTKKIMDRREKLENVLNEQKLNDSLRWIIIKSQFLQVVQNEFDQFCKTQIK